MRSFAASIRSGKMLDSIKRRTTAPISVVFWAAGIAAGAQVRPEILFFSDVAVRRAS